MYSILTPSQKVRDEMMRKLGMKGIDTRPFFYPMSSLPPFAGHPTHAPVSRELSERGLNLPSGPLLTESEIDFVTDAIREALGRSKRSKVTSITASVTARTRTLEAEATSSKRARANLPTRKGRVELPFQI